MFFKIFIFLILTTSCSMLGYLTEQGVEQVKLQFSGRNNDDFLSDPKVSDEMKRKVILVGEYKKFFYYYFNEKLTSIYSKTSVLPNSAVTYLVIASTHTEIKAKEFEFPIMGSFPYLGFFKKDSALDFASKLQKNENLVTYIRPVYAYSTLGYFEDRILSSFFHFNDVELAELVFHELFHTIFFIKDEIDLNENLANYFGKQLVQEYFKGREELAFYLQTEQKKNLLTQRVVDLIGILKLEFTKLGGFITDQKADILTQRFVDEVFKPEIQSFCTKIQLPVEDCEIRQIWNQASFAAFLTYEEDQDFVQKLKAEMNFDLKQYLSWLKQEYHLFKELGKEESFTDFLKTKVTSAPITSN